MDHLQGLALLHLAMARESDADVRSGSDATKEDDATHRSPSVNLALDARASAVQRGWERPSDVQSSS